MDERECLAKQFEANRTHLRKVAYRILGSVSEADDAVQESWIRITRAGGANGVEDLAGWLTTIVGRICVDMLRARRARREEPLGPHVPEPVDEHDPERDALLADSVGLALLVVLEKLAPAERVAYVLHDMFNLPFDQIAPIVGRSSEATRQLASRARRRVQGDGMIPDADRARQREIVEAFLLAARRRDFDALIAVLDPDVVLRVDRVAAGADFAVEIRSASEVAKRAIAFSKRVPSLPRPVLVNGAFGLARFEGGHPATVFRFTVDNGKIVEFDIIADPEKLQRLELTYLDDQEQAL